MIFALVLIAFGFLDLFAHKSSKIFRFFFQTDRANLASMKAEFDEIKKSVEKLQTTMKHVVDEHARKQKHIDVRILLITCCHYIPL